VSSDIVCQEDSKCDACALIAKKRNILFIQPLDIEAGLKINLGFG
jgi:hypothetical protein